MRQRNDEYMTVRWVAEAHSAEFGGPLTAEGFAAWYSTRFAREVAADYEDAKRLGLGLVEEYARHRRVAWIDDRDVPQRVADLIATDRMGYASASEIPSDLRARLFDEADAARWNRRRLRRQTLTDAEALKVARWVWKTRVDPRLTDHERLEYANMRDRSDRRQIGRSASELSGYSDEVAALLSSDPWRVWTYNEVARATQVDYQQALAALRHLATRPTSSVIALRERAGGGFELADAADRSETARPTHYKWCPDRAAIRAGGRTGVLERLAYQAIKRDPGIGKRGVRAALRDYLGGVKHAAVDQALDRLIAEGLITVGGSGERSRARYGIADLPRSERIASAL